jgi:hypothetical protein
VHVRGDRVADQAEAWGVPMRTRGRGARKTLVAIALASTLATVAVSSGTAAAAAGSRARPAGVSLGRPQSWNLLTGDRAAAGEASPQTGIVPPENPKSNIYPPNPDFESVCAHGDTIDESSTCLETTRQAIDNARATEPVGPMSFGIAGMQDLSAAEQLFAIVDLERVDRGLPPVEDLTSQLDGIAQAGADQDADPNLGSGVGPAGGGYFEGWGSNWAGGTIDPLASDFYWMYDDGYGSGNLDCTSPDAPSCWGHRDNILGTFLFGGNCSGPSALVMGAAASTSPHGGIAPSFAEIIAGQCGTPSGVVYTWAQARAELEIGNPPPVVAMASTTDGDGYWIANAAGKVWNFGDAPALGDLSGRPLTAPIAALVADPATGGFWLVAADGGVFGFRARYLGGEGGTHLAQPIVGMAATPDGNGYWLVAADGGVFAFGDARYRGSMGGRHLNTPIVGMAADPRTAGYWLVAADGGIFAFRAPFYGSEGDHHLNGRIVGMSVSGGGSGYRFVALDGGIFSFRSPFFGSEGGSPLNAAIVGMATDATTGGYWLVASDGGLFAFHAPFRGAAS